MRKMTTHVIRFILSAASWAALFALGLGLLPEIRYFFHDVAGQPFILADMLTGFALGGLLGLLQTAWMQRLHQRPLPYWFSASAIGGVLGGLFSGVVSVFIANTSSISYVHVLSLPLLLGTIGLSQWMVLRHQTRQAHGWVALSVLLGAFAMQGALVPVLLLALLAGALLSEWQRRHEPLPGDLRDTAAYRNACRRLRDAAQEAQPPLLPAHTAEAQQSLS